MILPRLLPVEPEAMRAAGERADVAPALLALLPRFERLFALVSDDAPGLACFGGALRLDAMQAEALGRTTLSATGCGFEPASALTSLLGEAADLLSPFEREGDIRQEMELPAVAGGWIAALVKSAAGQIDWIEGRDVASGTRVRIPADIVLRRFPARRRLAVRHALSSGVAAGPTAEAALERAALELIERDAATRWWQRGGPAHALAEGSAAASAFEQGLRRLRTDVRRRATMALMLPSAAGVPVAAVASRGEDGRGLACGLAARRDPVAAIDAALLEMAQMEMSAPIAGRKAEEAAGSALDATDRRHLLRAALDVRRVAALRPAGAVEPEAVAGSIVARLIEEGVALTAVNLTRADIGVPVMRAVSPQLLPFVFKEGQAAPY